MSVRHRSASRMRLRTAAGWVVAIGGGVVTAISIAPAMLTVGGTLLRSATPGTAVFALFACGLAALQLAAPAFLGLAVANARGRWPLWLALGLIAIVVVWAGAPFFGTLGVFWGPR